MTNAIETRRKALMADRNAAYAAQDWAKVNDITKRLAKLPVKSSDGTYKELR